MLPLEFVVLGIPVSAQSSNSNRKQRWAKAIAEAASARIPAGANLTEEDVKLTVVYYFLEGSLDLDNMMKPIADALKNVVYRDDAQVTDSQIRRSDINGSFRIAGMSAELAKGFCHGRDFIHVKIEAAPAHEVLL